MGESAEQRPVSVFRKELERTAGLNLYDFHARLYDPQLCRFLKADPFSHEFPATAPHLYCAAKPIMLTDLTGMYMTPYNTVRAMINKLFLENRLKEFDTNNKKKNKDESVDLFTSEILLLIKDIDDMINDPHIDEAFRTRLLDNYIPIKPNYLKSIKEINNSFVRNMHMYDANEKIYEPIYKDLPSKKEY